MCLVVNRIDVRIVIVVANGDNILEVMFICIA